MTVCAEIEAKVLAALRGRLDGLAGVVGFRESVEAGTLKASEGGAPEVRVTVSPGAAAEYGSPVVEHDVRVCVSVGLEDDDTQAGFDAACEAVETLVLEWNLDRNWEAMASELTTARFRADGFRAGGGSEAIDLSKDNPRLSAVYQFSVMGVATPRPSVRNGKE